MNTIYEDGKQRKSGSRDLPSISQWSDCRERGPNSLTTSSLDVESQDIASSNVSDGDSSESKWGPFFCKAIKRTLCITFFVGLALWLPSQGQKVNKELQNWFMKSGIEWLFPLVITLVSGIWLGFSPNGSMPAMLFGMIFKDNLWIALSCSYISCNLGAIVNLLWIRGLVIRHENSGCLKNLLNLLMINKIRKRRFLKVLFQTWDPIRIMVILRLPFVTSGTINYLSSFQPEYITVKQCLIANVIGFVPGSFLFTIFGKQIQEVAQFVGKWWNLETAQQRRDSIEENRVGIIVACLVSSLVIFFYGALFFYIRRLTKQSEEKETEAAKGKRPDGSLDI